MKNPTLSCGLFDIPRMNYHQSDYAVLVKWRRLALALLLACLALIVVLSALLTGAVLRSPPRNHNSGFHVAAAAPVFTLES